MLKSVKECLKNWLVTHERLYWYIVVGLAVLGFGIVTAFGFAKLERAEASVDVSVNWKGTVGTHTVYDLTELNWSMYYTGDYTAEQIISECSEYFVRKTYADTLEYVFLKNPIYYNDVSTGQMNFHWNDGDYFIKVNYLDGVWCVTQVSTTTDWLIAYNSGSNFILGSTYDYFAYNTQTNIVTQKELMPRNNLTYPKLRQYSASAPYVSFEKVDVVNPIAFGQTKSTLFQDIYEDYILSSSWTYYGKLNNINASKDLEYALDVEFLIEMPTDEFVDDVATDANINLDFSSKFLKYAPDMIEIWNVSGDDGCVAYKVNATIPLVVDDDGYFHFGFTFPELEYLLHMDENFHSRWVALTSDDNSYWKAVLLSHMHIDTLSMCVKTTQSDAFLYGKGVINVFERGIYDACVEIAPDIDFENTTEEEIDKIVKEAVDKAYEDYRKDLENRLDQLESQLNSTTSVQTGFGSLDGTDLWTGFQSLSAGLASLAPSISALSVLTGAVFGFMPSPITSIMTFTLFALCVIALIKAIRG